MPKELQLTQGNVAIVDDGDFLEVSQWKWTWTPSQRSDGYAARWEKRDGHKHKIYLHRYLMDARHGEQVDHVNGDGLDNRRENLRKCTASLNYANRKYSGSKESQYRGVYRLRGRWRATIGINGRTRNLGTYTCEEDAAKAYDLAAFQAFGEYARLNFAREQVA